MTAPILTTKLYIPPPRPRMVSRARLVSRLGEGAQRKLTVISGPAGFGKTTLLSEWAAGCGQPVAWLSLDEGDNDPARFLAYLIAALQTVAAAVGAGALAALQSPQPPPPEAVLIALLNELAAVPDDVVLVLDDYHVIDAGPVHTALAFLIEHLPPRMHVVIATRRSPQLPLARLRARAQLAELRAADLRFTLAETAGFLNQVMELGLSPQDIAALETRTEGWIVGLQLAALSMQGQEDAAGFIRSFAGSHRFVLDYLLEEVLQRQPESIQSFLLRTSVLDRLCGPLCDAVLRDPAASGQATLEYLEQANLFIVPLDSGRRWYRYHHLFAELLRQRLRPSGALPGGEAGSDAAELHRRASVWYEAQGLEIEAFQHAVAAGDLGQAARLVEGKGMPLHFRGGAGPVLSWLTSLSAAALDARPSLWVAYATALLFVNRVDGVEEKLQAAEAALRGAEPDGQTRDLLGQIAAARATVAVAQHQLETIVAQSRRALEYLHPGNLTVRTATVWTLGYAYELQGDRAAASRAYAEAVASSQAIGHFIITVMATMGLGCMQEADNRLAQAAETYRRVLRLAADHPLPVTCEAHLGLARVCYEWNDLEAAHRHGQQSLQLAQQIPYTDRTVVCEVFLARLRLARGDLAGAAALLAQAGQSARQHGFAHQLPEVAAAQVLALLRQGKLAAAAKLAQSHDLPLCQARVRLAQGDSSAALALLERARCQAEVRGWQKERLRALALQALALQAHGETDAAAQALAEALALAEPEGFIRLFADEGAPMARLLALAAARGAAPDYTGRLLAACGAQTQRGDSAPLPPAAPAWPLSEPLSARELEILRLIAQGLSNREIGERLSFALSTVKGYNQEIFDKLQVRSRTQAVARARELGLL